jgi:ATP-dependent helicase/nuclease subunit A
MRFYEYAAAYETSGRHGISGFVSYMEKTLEKGAFMAADAPGSEAVRIMTIHKSKGMEFPVVFICDLSGRFNTDDTRKPILIHPGMGIGLKILDNKRMYLYPTAVYEAISRRIREESLAEEMRILYVAMTRAKDKLIMTCAFPKAEEKLKSVLKNGENTDPERIRSADGPSKWLIPILAPYLRRPGIWVVDIVTGEAPGKNGEGEDITKDPLAEKDQVPHSPENRELLPSDGISDAGLPTGPDLYEKMIRERIEYRYPYAVLSQIPSKITATQLRGKAYESELSEDSALMFAAPYVLRRPRFAESVTGLTPAEKGTALHLAMQFVNLDRCRDTDSVKEEIGRLREMRILSDMQAEAVDAEKILRFTESGLGERMFRALDVRREFKFSVLDDARYYYPEAPEGEKVLVQGVCDLFFEEPDGMVVVDFKTDRISEQNLHRKADEYGRQLDLYASALERMTSKRVKEKYIYFFDLDRAVKV